MVWTREWFTVAASAVVISVAGCGGSQATSSGGVTASGSASASATTAATTTASAGGKLPLIDRVLTLAEVPGFSLAQTPAVVSGATAWAGGGGVSAFQGPSESARLRRLGFVSGVVEFLNGRSPAMSQALSLVEQYRSASSARAELVEQYAHVRTAASSTGNTFTPFAVPQLPGAVGFEFTTPSLVGCDIAFADGPFYYLVGEEYPVSAHSAPSRARVIALAMSLHRRVAGRGPS